MECRQPFPPFGISRMVPNFPAHPGLVTFVGEDAIERTEPAEALPVWLKFATAADGSLVPVVRIVRVNGERGFALRSYGPNGRLIAVTLPVPTTPPQPSELPTRMNVRSAEPAGAVSGWF